MTGRAAAALLAALLAAPAAAAEGGPIRGGEHAGFTRIVLEVAPTTEWSLELLPDAAVVSFPGREIAFSTAGVFDRIPRTRVAGVEVGRGAEGTAVTLALACDCRVSTAFVGARYLALDVHDRGARPTPAAAAAAGGEGPLRRDVTEALASAERILIGQIERAATQGLIELAAPEAAAPAPAPEEAGAPAPPEAPAAGAPAPLADDDRLLAHLATSLGHAHEQLEAVTVFDRDSRAARAAAALAPAAVPPDCREDAALDIARWSDGRPLLDQAVALQALLVGEFDRPNPDAVRDLARLYIRRGLGTEAGEILRGFAVELEERALLADLARLVEGRPPAADGPLALDVACPDRHGLWLALAGRPSQLAAEAGFAGLAQAFAEMPPDLRALIGPELVLRYLDAGRGREARALYDIAARSGRSADAAMELAAGRLAAFEHRPVEAEVRLAGLVAANAPNAPDALIALVRARLDFGDRVPPAWITDLGVLALEQRHGPREEPARALMAEALARNGDLAAGLGALARLAAERPASRPRVAELAPRLMAAADPERLGATGFAEAVLEHAGMIPLAPRHDAARLAIARKLLALGLPGPAAALLAPPVDRELPAARLLAAEAQLALGAPRLALSLLAGLDGAEAARLRARALGRRGDFAGAAATAAAADLAEEAAGYAWPAGAWDLAAGAEDPARAAMAGYMRDRAAAGPPPPLAASPTPAEAFRQPALRPPRPTLAGARALVANGEAVERFIEELIAPR